MKIQIVAAMKVIFVMPIKLVIPNYKCSWLIAALMTVGMLAMGCGHRSAAPPKKVLLAKPVPSVDVNSITKEQAAALIGQWRKSCRIGRGQDCYRLGRLFQLGLHLEQNTEEALLLYYRACENNSKAGCLLAGKLALDGSRSFYAPERAIASFARGCQLKGARACYEAGVFWLMGEETREDFHKASTYFGLSCRGEFGPACTHLGVMAQYGIGLKASVKSATLLFEKGCSHLDAVACFMAARVLHGENPQKALAYSQQSCLGEDMRGCVIRGDLARKANLLSDAKYYYGRACQLNSGTGCYRLGLLSKQPRALFEKACDADVAEACVAMGLSEMAEPTPLKAKASRLFEKACRENQAIGCFQLAQLWQNEPSLIPGPEDLQEAKRRACQGGVRQACARP